MLDTTSTVALLHQLDDQHRRDLIDACVQGAVHNAGANPGYTGRLVKLAAMIGEPG